MTDNAFAYTSSAVFKAALADLGARHLTTRPYTPRTNGKAERFIQTALREWLYVRSYPSTTGPKPCLPGSTGTTAIDPMPAFRPQPQPRS